MVQNKIETNVQNAIKLGVGNIMLKEDSLQAVFIEQYGVSIEFPVYYTAQTRLVPHE